MTGPHKTPPSIDEPATDGAWLPSERAALSAWSVPEPPADQAERVLAQARAEGLLEAGVSAARPPERLARWHRRRMRYAMAVGLVALAISGGLAVWLATSHGRVAGELAAQERTTVSLGRAGVAVAEAGSQLSWAGSRDELRVSQLGGNVFYRVDKGRARRFVVETEAGSVSVEGTCFRVELEADRSPGAASRPQKLATVSVYEGRVRMWSDGGDWRARAGDVVELRGGQPPRVLAEWERRVRGVSRTGATDGTASATDAAPSGVPSDLTERANQRLLADRDRLQAELDAVKQALVVAQKGASTQKVFGLSQPELLELAAHCELRWDTPALSGPQTIEPDDATSLGLSASEQQVINRIQARFHQRMQREIRALYLEVTGELKVADVLSPSSMLEEIFSKSVEAERGTVFQRLARERAGLAPARTDLAGASPFERAMRLVTGAGDYLEVELAKELGPDLGRRYRAHRGGFSSKSRSRQTCPAR